jgi:hypothetical protein
LGTLLKEEEIMNRLLLIITFLFISANTFAMDWILDKEKNKYILKNSEYKNTEVIPDAPVSLKITEVKTHGKFTLVIINFGEVGTSCLIRRHKAYIFNNKMKKFLGAHDYKVIAVPNKVKTCTVKAINWEFYKDKILIHDLNFNKKYEVK